MADYIDRQVVNDALDKTCDLVCQYSKKQRYAMCGACPLGSAYDVFENVPSADVQPVRHGRWEIYQLAELGQAWTIQCSACHAIGFHGKTPYCCECGARMDGE